MEIRMVHREEIGYPACLNDLSKRPSPLYYKGDLTLLGKGNCVAVIGKRDAEPAAVQMSLIFLKIKKRKECVIVSGRNAQALFFSRMEPF